MIGGAGAIIATKIGMPLPWMLGSMALVTLAALLKAPVRASIELRNIMVPILGVMLGSGFHPSIFERIADWGVTLAALPVFILLAFGGSFLFYWKIGRYDPVTAYFSAAPGGLNDMLIIGSEAGGSERHIALAHAARVFLVVTFVALFYSFALDVQATGDARPYVSIADVPVPDLAILAGCAVIGTLAGPYLRLPAPQILGPMILSAIVHLTGWTDAPPPSLAVNAAQLVIGTLVGCRFAGVTPSEILRDLSLAAGSSTLMVLIALATAVTVARLTGLELSQTFLAFSPGGLPEMSLLALAMGADIAFVATLHIARITLVIAIAPLVFKLLKR